MAPRPSLPSSLKKRKAASNTSPDDAAKIQKLEEQVTTAVTSKTSLNPLTDLLEAAQNATEPSILTKAIYALYRSYVVIITNGLLSNIPANEEAKAVRAWLNERLHEYTELLVGLLKDEDATLRVRLASRFPMVPQIS